MKFTEALKDQVLIMDGAMGPMVQELELSDSAFGGSLFKMLTDLLTFSRPDELEGIHLKYLEAGANIIETNTFGASPLRLTEFDFPKIERFFLLFPLIQAHKNSFQSLYLASEPAIQLFSDRPRSGKKAADRKSIAD